MKGRVQMKSATMEMTKNEAMAEVKKWRIGRTQGDQRITKAFRAIARGEKVIDLYKTMEMAGIDAQGRPMLAIARSDAKACRGLAWSGSERVEFRSEGIGSGRLNCTTTVPVSFVQGCKVFDSRARVPTVPPIYRRSNPEKYLILFEAAWQAVTKDPMLLEPLGGALYRVVAAWDLTPVEQVVLRGRTL